MRKNIKLKPWFESTLFILGGMAMGLLMITLLAGRMLRLYG